MGKNPTLVLASGSPRRRDLLEGLGLDFLVRPADLDESLLPAETPEEHVQRLALEKARFRVDSGELVLAADTVVIVDGEILGKPRDTQEARAMLSRLAGRRHVVFSGVALVEGKTMTSAHGLARTQVEILPMTEGEIAWYVDTREPMDKAGAYAIQGLGCQFVGAIEGNYTNVVGLPLPLTRSLCRELGFSLRDFRHARMA